MPRAGGRSAGQEAKIIKAHERALEALRLRKQSFTYQEIAERVGYADASGAFLAVKNAIHRITADDAEALMLVESEKLDVMERQANQILALVMGGKRIIKGRDIETGEERAIETILTTEPERVAQLLITKLKVMERRARLFGLDAPPKTPVDGGLSAPPPQIILAYGQEALGEVPEQEEQKKVNGDSDSQ